MHVTQTAYRTNAQPPATSGPCGAAHWAVCVGFAWCALLVAMGSERWLGEPWRVAVACASVVAVPCVTCRISDFFSAQILRSTRIP